jgi:outer membrane protein
MSNIFKVLVIFFLMICFAGCEEFASEESFYKFRPSQEQLQTIDTLKLAPQKQNEPNMPPPRNSGTELNELKLSLEQCRAYTLSNNLELKVQLIDPAIAQETLSAEEAKFEASFVADTAYTKLDSPTSTELVGTEVTQSTTNVGIQKPLESGGTAAINLMDDRTNTNNEFSTLNPAYDSALSLSLSQPLLRNAGKKVNTYSIRVAGYELDISKAQTKLEMIRVLSAADRVYWRLYAARKALDVHKQEYELAVAQLKQAKRFVELGEAAEVEIIRAEAGVTSKVEAIIVSENLLRDREREIKQVLNIPGISPQTKTIILPATEPDPIRFVLDRDKLVTAATDNRMEMLELELQIAIAADNIDFMQNQALPLVAVNYTYRINGLGATQSDAYDMLFDKNFEDHRLGLSMVVPIGNEAAKSRMRRAIYEKKQKLATRAQRELTIENEVLNATDQLEASWQKIVASRDNAIMAARLYEAEKRQFELGLQTSTDVLNAAAQYSDAKRLEIEAVTDYEISRVDLAYATGTVLGATKIHWTPALSVSLKDPNN